MSEQHPDNRARADSTREPLRSFTRERGIQEEEVEVQITDLITNLLHLCETNGIDPYVVAASAIGGYVEELRAPDFLGPRNLIQIHVDGRQTAAVGQ